MTDISDMKGKTMIVTGASSGLGRSIAVNLGNRGANLYLVGRSSEGLAETASLLEGSIGRVRAQSVDLEDRSACEGIVDAAINEFGQLDALCNAAGVLFVANTPEMPLDQWDTIMATNLAAPFILSQKAIPHLLKTEGSIVNVSSAAACTGQAYGAAYGASKAGLVAMTRSMALEYAKQSIRVNAIAPGGMMTNAARTFVPPEGCDFDLMKRFTGPRGGMVEVDDVAAMVVHLISDAGKGFNGACINLDAGITAG